MANEVYANGREISCKAAEGKSICAFPDVCMTPPENPATPPGVPVPYPNTGFGSDTTSGSQTVKISGKETMLKDKSYFKQSTGDEAGAAAKKGVVTSVNRGKVYFTSWSMDVKFEGENVVRHLDMTTHNHASSTTNTPPWAHIDSGAFATSENCATDKERVEANCSGDKEKDCKESLKDNKCVQAKRCQFVPYRPKSGCCPTQTAHHVVPKRAFKGMNQKKGKKAYRPNDAPCVCAEGHSWHRNDRSKFPKAEKTHPDLHDVQDYLEREAIDAPKKGRTSDSAMTYGEARDNGIAAHQAVFPTPSCNPDCLKDQLDGYHVNEVGVKPEDPVRTSGGIRNLATIIKDKLFNKELLVKAREHLAAIGEKAKTFANLAKAP